MAAPGFGSIGTFLFGTSTTCNIAVPASTVSGSVNVAYVYVDGTATITGLPTGFAQAAGSPVNIGGGSGTHRLYVMWKRATGADSGTYNFTLSGSIYRAGAVIRYTNVISSGDPWDTNVDTDFSTTSSTSSIPVDIATTGPDRLICWAVTNWSGGTWTAPSGYTLRIGTQGDRVHAQAELVQAVAGTTGSVTGSCTGSDKRTAWLGALIGTTVVTAPKQLFLPF